MEQQQQYFEGVGRRKTSTARVRIYPGGNGTVTINEVPAQEYLTALGAVERALRPFEVTDLAGRFNVTVKVSGGGPTGQTEAIRLGIARALLKYDENLRPSLRRAGLLTRDPREKERKKPGLKRARKAPTYTKR
ncbi:MAG: 30S ribosomal protein S9 [Phototrophicales bacterium]|nr:MAG: 30S ribosomal protein S9 [Phototrophicales bacterium]